MRLSISKRVLSPLCVAALTLSPLAANAGCIATSSTADGAINGPGDYTTEDGHAFTLEVADYTPHGDNALGFVVAEMRAVECLEATEGLALNSAAMRLNFTGDMAVNSVTIDYCTSYPIINISAGSETPPAYHENWKKHDIPGEIADDNGNMVAVMNEPTWNGDIYMDEAKLTLTSDAGLPTALFGMREGFVMQVCVE